MCAQVVGDARGDSGSPVDPERATLGEVVLNVDDQQRASHEVDVLDVREVVAAVVNCGGQGVEGGAGLPGIP